MGSHGIPQKVLLLAKFFTLFNLFVIMILFWQERRAG